MSLVSAQSGTLVTSGVIYNSDSTANSSRSRTTSIRVPQNLINPNQSWVAIRMRMGIPSTTTLSPDPNIFDMSESDPRSLFLYYDVDSDTFHFERNYQVGGTTVTSTAQSFAIGTYKTIIAAWTPTQIKISIDGAPFRSVNTSSLPAQAALYFGSSAVQGAVRQPNSDYVWAAAGTGLLTDANAATIHSFGNTDYPRSSFPGSATFIWKANSDTYNDDNGSVTSTPTNSPTISPTRPPSVTATNSPTTTNVPTLPPPSGGTRIDAGATSSSQDSSGNVWNADTGFSGGTVVNRGAVSINNTNDDFIYQTERYGMTGYALNVQPGVYRVRLHFAETSASITAAGQRVFDLDVEGREALDVDIFSLAGGRNTAYIREFSDVDISDGTLNIDFSANVQSTLINGIEVIPVSTTSPLSADGNNDGKVDGIDFVIWLNHYGQNVTGKNNGDFNSDGRVDGIDYVVWLSDYGRSNQSATVEILSPVNGSTVPSSFQVQFSTNWF